jgi:hypothetical protein
MHPDAPSTSPSTKSREMPDMRVKFRELTTLQCSVRHLGSASANERWRCRIPGELPVKVTASKRWRRPYRSHRTPHARLAAIPNLFSGFRSNPAPTLIKKLGPFLLYPHNGGERMDGIEYGMVKDTILTFADYPRISSSWLSYW